MGEKRGAYKVLVGKSQKKDHLEDPGIEGRIILKCFFTKWDGGINCIDLVQDRVR
jgi:hypothetical protein